MGRKRVLTDEQPFGEYNYSHEMVVALLNNFHTEPQAQLRDVINEWCRNYVGLDGDDWEVLLVTRPLPRVTYFFKQKSHAALFKMIWDGVEVHLDHNDRQYFKEQERI